MFNKERFHNQLALNLGYERLLKDARYDIKVEYDNQDNPVVTILMPNNMEIVICASERCDDICSQNLTPEVKDIIHAVQKAYTDSSGYPFSCYI